jgi:hypothetical protein
LGSSRRGLRCLVPFCSLVCSVSRCRPCPLAIALEKVDLHDSLLFEEFASNVTEPFPAQC